MLVATAVMVSGLAFNSANAQEPRQRGERRMEQKENAQPGRDRKGGEEWENKIKAAKVAFLTAEMDLSPEEAQKFWPVYNKAEAERTAALKNVRKSYKELSKAVKDGKDDKEISKLMDEYYAATKESAKVEAEFGTKVRKVLTPTKAAKLLVSEEKFRKMQFNRSRDNNHPREGHPGMDGKGNGRGPGRPEGNRPEGPAPRQQEEVL